MSDALQVASVEVTVQVIRADGTVEEPETYVTVVNKDED